ncbi:MAG TPA: hypothetical protein VMS65_02455 [Polyangiaceae bacterium]|nr:hypothetical protein [Polyangiaceae bacterium]
MNDPTRLLDEGANAFETRLLRAGRDDAPRARSRRRVLAGLGLGGVFSTIAVSTGAEASVRAWFVATGGAAVGAAAIWGGVALMSAPPVAPAPQPKVESAEHAPLARAPAPREAPVPETAPAVEAPPVAPPARSLHAAPASDPSLSDEVAALEVARSALRAGDPGSALRSLDDYARTFRKKSLAAEATVLRIEALSASGDRAGARRLGESFLRMHPKGPYEKRVRSLIDE